MDQLTVNKIHETFELVRDASYREKRKGINSERQVNEFLDHILDLQKLLKQKSLKIAEINRNLEAVTWLNDLDEQALRRLNDLVASAKDLHSVLIRQYKSLDDINDKGIVKEVTGGFKSAIDDLKEIIADIESAFFFLPRMPDFVETTRELSLLR